MMEQPELIHILAQTDLFTDGKVYVILKADLAQGKSIAWEPGEWPASFWACLRDKDEVTLVLAQDSVARLPPSVTVLDVSPPYRLITFDIPLAWGVTGYLAALTSVLAEAEISLFALSAFSRDHIFVAAADFGRAWDGLYGFIRTCRTQVIGFEADRESR
jgi:hypothetical protein